MKTTRLIIGIISMVLFLVISFQSCAVGIGEAIMGESGEGLGLGSSVAWILLIAGIVAVCTRKSIVGAYITAGFYALAGIIGISYTGEIYGDLPIWGGLSLIFAIVFVLGGILTQKQKNKKQDPSDEQAE